MMMTGNLSQRQEYAIDLAIGLQFDDVDRSAPLELKRLNIMFDIR
jgi:hypothetical protein